MGCDFRVALAEEPHPEGPYGAKGAAESAMGPTASAIANALFDAAGVRLTRLPMTPERVLHAIKNKEAASSNAELRPSRADLLRGLLYQHLDQTRFVRSEGAPERVAQVFRA